MRVFWGLFALPLLLGPPQAPESPPDIRLFFQAAAPDEKQAQAALDAIAASWRDGYAAMIVDLARFMRRGRTDSSDIETVAVPDDEASRLGPERPSPRGEEATPRSSPQARVRLRLIRFLTKQTHETFGDDLNRWRHWIWDRPYEPHPDYALFKATLYSLVDSKMANFFPPAAGSLIRLDEIDWGGVRVNGIPPLDHPKHIEAKAARYLKDTHIVFGLLIDGEARAYPKRILAWHEMARDRLGRTELTIVYCTLCGTVVPYASNVGGALRTFGTSGLLYRSNKLMFDEETFSLWSTTEGKPVVGPAVGSGLELDAYPVVTTTWREWVSAHPRTTVLSLETGYKRDYSEGAAYHDYFSTDHLMFEVPKKDTRLKNKAEVVGVLLPRAHDHKGGKKALALSVAFLKKHTLHQRLFEGHNLVIVTSPDGANRVYDAGDTHFVQQTSPGTLLDSEGRAWRVEEEALVAESGARCERIPSRRAFWFGFYAQFPDAELVGG